jgi:hypothetical protein
MKAKAFLAMIIALMLSAAAYADIHVKDYKAAKAEGGESWKLMKIFVAGSGTALSYANSELVRNHKAPLFCQPDPLRIRAENFLDIIDTEMVRKKDVVTDDTYLEILLIEGLIYTFPCKS